MTEDEITKPVKDLLLFIETQGANVLTDEFLDGYAWGTATTMAMMAGAWDTSRLPSLRGIYHESLLSIRAQILAERDLTKG